MSGRDWRGLGSAVLIGAVVAFPLGMMFANRDAAHQEARPAARGNAPAVKANMRKVYSPIVVKDPYVLDQQRIVVEALEAQCRDTGDHCREAKAARRWLNEQYDRWGDPLAGGRMSGFSSRSASPRGRRRGFIAGPASAIAA